MEYEEEQSFNYLMFFQVESDDPIFTDEYKNAYCGNCGLNRINYEECTEVDLDARGELGDDNLEYFFARHHLRLLPALVLSLKRVGWEDFLETAADMAIAAWGNVWFEFFDSVIGIHNSTKVEGKFIQFMIQQWKQSCAWDDTYYFAWDCIVSYGVVDEDYSCYSASIARDEFCKGASITCAPFLEFMPELPLTDHFHFTGYCDDLESSCTGEDAGREECCLDSDGDGIPDFLDNCNSIFNPLQSDCDGNGFGDACDESDLDGDNVVTHDNCPCTSNVDQVDSDGDGWGDECDHCPDQFDAIQNSSIPCYDESGDYSNQHYLGYDEECSDADIQVELEHFRQMMECYFNAGVSADIPDPGEPCEYSQPSRACTNNNIQNAYGLEGLCFWWDTHPLTCMAQNNLEPPGISEIINWGNFGSQCYDNYPDGNGDGAPDWQDMNPNQDVLESMWHMHICCYYTATGVFNEIQARIETLQNQIACLTPYVGFFDCLLFPKLTIAEWIQALENEILNLQAQQININQTMNEHGC